MFGQIVEIVSAHWTYPLVFLAGLSFLVFFHELGHYAVARWNGVRIDTFAIGFGREIWGFTDRSGTRWKFGLIPMGGYVKMFGDRDESSRPDDGLEDMSAQDRAVSFHHKRLWQRTAVVAAGPVANFILAIALFMLIFLIAGRAMTPPVVGKVHPDSAAMAAGFQPQDTIVAIDGRAVTRFEDLVQVVRLNPGKTMPALVRRDGREITLEVTPKRIEIRDAAGHVSAVGQLGIEGGGRAAYVRLGPIEAITAAFSETWRTVVLTGQALGQIVTGTRSADELGGPVRIFQVLGLAADAGVIPLLTLLAILSVNLGLFNLLPIPVLDGGHLMFYAYEAVRGRPLGERAQVYAFRGGLALVLGLMVFVTWNDIVGLIGRWSAA